MNPNDQYPLDYTGYGPTGGGNAPTAREMRTQAMNRFRTDRMSSAMQFIDPYVDKSVGTMMSSLMDAKNTPGEARRAAYQSAGGQAAMDAAMLARRGGFLGQGDPVNYAANISSGVAGGGFQTSIGGTMDGRRVHGMGRVSGQGAIAERVSMNFGKGMLQDLYGSGMPDPGKLSGFDMEEASGVFNTLARRGIIGHAAHVERNADMNTRLGAAREAAIDPSIKQGLAALELSGTSPEEDTKQINKAIEGTDDKKLKREFTKIRDSTDAVLINDKGRQRILKVVREVTEGMGALADIYGDLSSTELMQKLEEVGGQKITNSQQAKRAKSMVSELRGAAVISGMDPRAFQDWSGDMQGMLQGDVMQAGGFDQRTASQSKAVTAAMHHQMVTDSAVSSRISNQNTMRARAQGIDAADAPTLDEIYEDKRQGRTQFMDKYKAVAMTQGGLDNFSGVAKERASRLLEEFKATGDIKDSRERAQKRALINAQLEGAQSDLYGGVGFDAAASSRSAQVALSKAYSDPKNAREMERMAAQGRAGDINVHAMAGMLGGDLKDAQQMRDSLGVAGMTDFLRDSKGDESAEVKKAKQANILKQAGLNAEDAAAFMSKYTDADGNIKDAAGFKQAASFLSSAGYEGGMAQYDQAEIGQNRMDMIGADGNRKKLRSEDQGVTVNSIATALLTGGATGVNDAESMSLTMQAMADAGMDVPDFESVDSEGNLVMKSAKDSFATGLDFSGGLTAEGLGKLDKLHGKGLGLAKKMGYGSREELIAATKGDANLRADALKMLQLDEDYAGINLSGDQFGMTAITEEARSALNESGEISKTAQKWGGALMINKSLGLSEEESTNLLKEDGSFDASRFSADAFGKFAGSGWFDGAKRLEMGGGLGRNLNLSGLVGEAGTKGMDALANLDEEGALSDNLQAQYDELKKAKELGSGDLMVEYKGKGGKDAETTIDEAMNKIEAAMIKLAEKSKTGGAQLVEEMTVTTLKVENSTSNN